MPGAQSVVKALAQRGLKMTVVTGSGEKTTIDRLKLNFNNVFDREKIVTAYDVKFGKPNPESYLCGLKKLNMPAHYTMVVENAPLGVKAAKAAGIFTVAVNTGILDDKELYDAGANIVFSNMNELKEAIDDIVD